MKHLITDRITPEARAVVGNALYMLAVAAGPLAIFIASLVILWTWQALGLPS